jgi:hypothetical protein
MNGSWFAWEMGWKIGLWWHMMKQTNYENYEVWWNMMNYGMFSAHEERGLLKT